MSKDQDFEFADIHTQNSEEHKRNISLWIDGYDDIFSDFDPRGYDERNISDDFLYEVKKISWENDFTINELLLLVPENSRNPNAEAVVIKRLHEHFRKNHNYLRKQTVINRRSGFIRLATGMMMMFLASYISSLHSQHLAINMLFVILEPAGWFIGWIGLETLFKTERSRDAELHFYSKMQRAKIGFECIANN